MSNFEVLAHMCEQDKDIAMSVNNLVEVKKHRAGGLVTVGVDSNSLNKIMASAVKAGGTQYHVLLLVINADQYEESSRFIKSQTP